MKVSGHHAANWSAPHQAASTGTSKAKVTINPEVENYRLIAGKYGAQLLDHALNYSLSIPLTRRGITKIVVDGHQDEVLHNYYSMGQSLRERLLQEGIEILLLDDILAFLDKKYPQFSATIKCLEQLNRRIGTDDPIWAQAVMAAFYQHLIFYFLPDYAFTTSQNPHLTEVTVSDNFFLSSLFLPATSHTVASPLRLILEARSASRQVPSILVDGDALLHMTAPNVRSAGLFASRKKPSELQFTLFPRHYLSIQSSQFARSLAQSIHSIVANFMTRPNLIRITSRQHHHNQDNPDFFSQNSKTLNELINDYNRAEESILCFQLIPHYGVSKSGFACWDNNLPAFYLDLGLQLMVMLNVKFVFPVLKDIADQCKVDVIEPSVAGHELPLDTSSYPGSDFFFRLTFPSLGLSSNSSAAMDCFRQRFLLNPSDQLKLKYHTKIKVWLNDQPPKCDPALNSNDIIRIITSTDQSQALLSIGSEIISSYPSRAYNFCRMDDNSTRVVNTQPPLSSQASDEGYSTTTNSAFTMGMISGVISGGADQLGHGYLMDHPITRGAVGYCCAGVAGLGLGIWGWALHTCLPHRLRAGAERGSLRHNCAMLVENLSMVLPVLTGGVYQYATSVAGFLLGKYGIKLALGKVWPDQQVVTPQQPASSSKRQKRRSRPATPAEPVATPNENSNAGNAWDDSVVLRNQTVRKLLDSGEPLPWTIPGIDGMVIAHAQGMADRQERAGYLKKQLQQCELATGGVLSAVSRFPELYGEYLHTHQGNDVERAKALWTVLSPGSPQKLLLLVGKMVIQDSLNNNKPVDALAMLNDPKLTGEACMNIINDLGGTDILFINDVPEKLARAYLAQVNRKERKQKNPEHILKAVTQWLAHFNKKPGLSDNLIHLNTDLRLTGLDGDRIFHDFRRTLKRQAEVEVKYLPDGRHKVQRYLRAKAIEIALQESNYYEAVRE